VPRYRVQDLGGLMAAAGLNVFDSRLEDINNAGTVVGGGRGSSPLFVIEPGRLSLLPVGTVSEGRATAINERGDILAWTLDNRAGGGYRDMVYRNGVVTRNITAPPGTGLGPVNAMNDAGQAIGQVMEVGDNGGAIGEWLPIINDAAGSRLITVPSARAADARALNDHGTVTGTADLYGRGSRVFVWRDGHSDILPVPIGGGDSPDDYYYGLDINNAGQVLVHHMTYGPGASRADFIYQDGHYTRLPLDADQRFDSGGGWDINEHGWVVGQRTFETPDGAARDQRAFLYRDGQVHDLDSLLRPQDAQRWQLFEAQALNDRGQIIGMGYLNGQWRQYLATPVPEPSAGALLGAGLGLVWLAARRGRSRGG
jgi:probable HAF family extracellular repeat protein